MSTLQAKVINPSLDIEKPTAEEFNVIMALIKSYGDYSTKTIEEEITPKVLSRGEQLIEEAKAKNRALIAQKREQEKKNDQLSGLDQLKEQVRQAHESWKQQVDETHKQWKKEQDIFLGRIKTYKANTFQIPAKEIKIIEKKVILNLPQIHVIKNAFNLPIKDQANRPTCAAFAGVRALETIIKQNNEEKDLSEQYLYWASKPNCQNSPCEIKGSWVTGGYDYSMKQIFVDIPSENVCDYKTEPMAKNETQIPLSADCKKGVAKVLEYKEVTSINDLLESIKKNIPVVLASKLTENFYINQGLILLSDSSKSYNLKLDGHSNGHAFLAIGFIELPEKLKTSEGTYCILIANSWGKGWGAGGYSCLSENYLKKYRLNTTFIAPIKLEI